MKQKLILIAAVGCTQLFTACETTGNPREGGIFWSEEKAQDRLAVREDHLTDVRRDTRRVERKNAGLESAVDRRKRMLGE